MTESNLNIVLSNALCCSATKAKEVSKLYSIGNSCADEELAKLKLLNDRIEELRCYNFDVTQSVWNYSIPTNPADSFVYFVLTDIEYIKIVINGVVIQVFGNNVDTIETLFVNYMTTNNLLVSLYRPQGWGSFMDLFIVCTGEVLSLALYTSKFNGELSYPGLGYIIFDYGPATVTATEAVNCLTEEQQDLMAHQIMTTCEICDCQLTY